LPRFKEYDVNGDGYINLAEASTILQESPFNFPKTKVFQLLMKFDMDGNGKLDIEEFADFYSGAKAMNKKLQEQFDELDKDGNGVLDVDEVKALLGTTMGLDDDSCLHLIKIFDTNDDGQLDKAEFIELWDKMF